MKEIELSQGKVAMVDDEDYDLLSKMNWVAHKERNSWYAWGYEKVAIRNYKRPKMHRVIMNAPDGVAVDHIDGNGLNNQKSNLRFCTNQENLRNSTKRKGCSSKFKGVSYHKQNDRWRATITIDKRQISLGCYGCEIDAALAYNRKAAELFGEFANLNPLLFEQM